MRVTVPDTKTLISKRDADPTSDPRSPESEPSEDGIAVRLWDRVGEVW